MEQKDQRTIAVIGAGYAGLTIVHELLALGYNIRCFGSRSDGASVRNEGIFHSGIILAHYALSELNSSEMVEMLKLVSQLKHRRKRFERHVGKVDPNDPSTFGIIGLTTSQAERHIEILNWYFGNQTVADYFNDYNQGRNRNETVNANLRGIELSESFPEYFQPLNIEQAQDWCGNHYDNKLEYYRIPDKSFDSGSILTSLKKSAKVKAAENQLTLIFEGEEVKVENVVEMENEVIITTSQEIDLSAHAVLYCAGERTKDLRSAPIQYFSTSDTPQRNLQENDNNDHLVLPQKDYVSLAKIKGIGGMKSSLLVKWNAPFLILAQNENWVDFEGEKYLVATNGVKESIDFSEDLEDSDVSILESKLKDRIKRYNDIYNTDAMIERTWTCAIISGRTTYSPVIGFTRRGIEVHASLATLTPSVVEHIDFDDFFNGLIDTKGKNHTATYNESTDEGDYEMIHKN